MTYKDTATEKQQNLYYKVFKVLKVQLWYFTFKIIPHFHQNSFRVNMEVALLSGRFNKGSSKINLI